MSAQKIVQFLIAEQIAEHQIHGIADVLGEVGKASRLNRQAQRLTLGNPILLGRLVVPPGDSGVDLDHGHRQLFDLPEVKRLSSV